MAGLFIAPANRNIKISDARMYPNGSTSSTLLILATTIPVHNYEFFYPIDDSLVNATNTLSFDSVHESRYSKPMTVSF